MAVVSLRGITCCSESRGKKQAFVGDFIGFSSPCSWLVSSLRLPHIDMCPKPGRLELLQAEPARPCGEPHSCALWSSLGRTFNQMQLLREAIISF